VILVKSHGIAKLALGVLIGGLGVLLVLWFAENYFGDQAALSLLDALTKLVPPLVASFAGATAAFYYNAHKDRQTKGGEEISAGNLAMFHLHQMYSVLATFQKHFIDPIRQDPERWINMDSPAVPGMIRPVEFDFVDLAFLLNDPPPTSPAPQVLSDLLFIQERFRTFTQVVDSRTRFIVEAAEARSKITVSSGTSAAQALLMATRSSGLQQRLSAVADDLVARVDRDMADVRDLIGRLRNALVELHPTGAFIELKFQA
jgi:hypothetical protein